MIQNEVAIEEVLRKWEPQIWSMIKGSGLNEFEREDLAQILRHKTTRAYERYDPSFGASFHTFLYTVLKNSMRTFMSRRQKLEGEINDDTSHSSYLSGDSPESQLGVMEEYIAQAKLNCGEALLLDMYLCGYNTSEIMRMSPKPHSVAKVKKSLRKKFRFLRGE